MALARSVIRGVRRVVSAPRVAKRQLAIAANVDKVRHVPGAEFGYVPFAFSKQYPDFMAQKAAQYAATQDAIYADYNRRYSNAKYTHPFTPEQYKAVFGSTHEALSGGQVAALQIVVQHLADPKLIAALGNKYDNHAWELYKKFRFRTAEDSSPFGAEANAIAKPLDEKKPASWTATQTSAIPLSRVFKLPAWSTPLVDLNATGSAIDIFKAYAAAVDKIANALKFPNSDAATAKVYATAVESVQNAFAASYDPAYKPGDSLTVEQFAQKVAAVDAELAQKEADVVNDFVNQIKTL
eukprot:TRINITY_DN1369_c0_g1_i1.p1 TRINITY_DN1369_c0_g1~~TRINITY_DN1369_c0_g1_i1.p1  ORF type:complete len:296 (-),score=106.12 TRINITY_DN1369_c0_g1_i1:228-1115(-)